MSDKKDLEAPVEKIELKEGIVLDAEGRPIGGAQSNRPKESKFQQSFRGRTFVFGGTGLKNMGLVPKLLLGVTAIATLALGFVVILGVGAVFFLSLVFRALFTRKSRYR